MIGSIPPSLGNLSALEVFATLYNNLVESTPDSFGQLTKLTFIGISSNMLSGTIPPSISNLSSLVTFDVGFNQIQGHLPLDIAITLLNFEAFIIGNNRFSGSIPISIPNASNLVKFQLNENKLVGNVPSLEKLNGILSFLICLNHLGSGGANDLSFLYSLTNATYLTKLQIQVNSFGGELPKCIVNFSTTLTILNLDNN